MIVDAVEYAKRYKACQIHADFIHQPPKLLHLTVTTWLFEAWRIDVIRPIIPPSVRGHRFILTITDYFPKWVEVVRSLKLKRLTLLTSLNTMSSIDLVYPEGSSMTTVLNLRANHSIGFVINVDSECLLDCI